MSWGQIVAEGTLLTIGSSLMEAAQTYIDNNTAQGNPPTEDMITAIKTAATHAASLAALGNYGANLHISLNGHTNPGFRPTEGWSNDYVSIVIRDTSLPIPA